MTAAWRFYFLMPVRAWKATAPDLTGHRPQIAGNRNADRIARPSPLPVYSHVSDPPFANQLIHVFYKNQGKRAARTVLTGMCYSVGSATRQGSSSLTRFIGQ
ncbi:hypothetical protein ACB321_31980, partial [Klebsiella michiganensis]